jgi:hypothetical protein
VEWKNFSPEYSTESLSSCLETTCPIPKHSPESAPIRANADRPTGANSSMGC